MHTVQAGPSSWFPLVLRHPQVLDRVLVHGSGESWWAVLSGRAKLGKLAAERSSPVGRVSIDRLDVGAHRTTGAVQKIAGVLASPVIWVGR